MKKKKGDGKMNHSGILTVKTDCFEMDYFSFGEGERNFVIIPGVSLESVMVHADDIANHFSYYGDRYTVYVFDRKKDIRPGYSVEQMAEDTAEAMKILGISHADIFGASQGGMMAQCIAIEHPELAAKLCLASTIPRNNETSRKVISRWVELAGGSDIRALNHEVFTKIYSPEYYNDFRAAFEAAEGIGTPEDMARFKVMVEAVLDFDVYDRLDRIKCPVFVIGSEYDQVLSCVGSKEIAEKLGCYLYLYPGLSHGVYDEAANYRTKMFGLLE